MFTGVQITFSSRLVKRFRSYRRMNPAGSGTSGHLPRAVVAMVSFPVCPSYIGRTVRIGSQSVPPTPARMTAPFFLLTQILPPAPVHVPTDVVFLFEKAGVSLLIGALIGLERERSLEDSHKLFAGIRTFPLIGLFGFLAALLGHVVTPWLLVALTSCYFTLVIVAYVFSARAGYHGATSELAAVIIFLLGVLVYWEFFMISIAISVVLTLFLSIKAPLQNFIGKVQEEDIYATLKFAIITAIILPVLPNQTMGPFDVLNPRQIWYMVVLIAGISFGGYVLVKIFGSRKGLWLTGFLGGLVSSTAVTLSFSQKSKTTPDLSRTFASAIVLACSIMPPRILIEIAVVNPSLLHFIWPYIVILTATGVGASVLLLLGAKKDSHESVELSNPFELLSAIKFGLIFAIILFVSKAAQFYFGDSGVLLAAALAGTTDVDAITLSMANLAKTTVTEVTASTAILIAITVNTIVKAGIAVALGAAALRRFTLPAFGAVLGVGVIIVCWLIIMT
jgi:uncharacterized membrane protein (DUF4010 family)